MVEDDDNIRDLVAYTLNSSGMEATGFRRPSDFWNAMKESRPSLILLDIMLPEEDGLSILRKIRTVEETRQIPVIMLTAKDSEYDKVIGLDSGADDYVAKPFGMMELLSRIKALLRRTESLNKKQKSETFFVGSLMVCPETHVVTANNVPVALTRKEFDLLCVLLRNRNVVLSREQLLDAVWGYAFDGESRTVDVHVRTLRQKLGKAGNCIETIRGVGYKIGMNYEG